jgi:hypothetical protein
MSPPCACEHPPSDRIRLVALNCIGPARMLHAVCISRRPMSRYAPQVTALIPGRVSRKSVFNLRSCVSCGAASSGTCANEVNTWWCTTQLGLFGGGEWFVRLAGPSKATRLRIERAQVSRAAAPIRRRHQKGWWDSLKLKMQLIDVWCMCKVHFCHTCLPALL